MTKQATLCRLKLETTIRGTNGRYFGVTFIKKDGSERKMLCQLGNRLSRPPKRASSDKKTTSYILVSDVKLMAQGRQQGKQGDDLLTFSYRLINLATITELRYAGITYQID